VGRTNDADLDDALRRVGTVDDTTVERVARAALTASRRSYVFGRRGLAAAALFVCLLGIAGWWLHHRRSPPALSVETSDHLLYVRAPDGTSWIMTWPPDGAVLPEGTNIVIPTGAAGERR